MIAFFCSLLLFTLLIPNVYARRFFIGFSIGICLISAIVASNDSQEIAFICLLVIIFLTISLYFTNEACKKKDFEKKQIREAHRIKIEKEKEERENADKKKDAELEAKYGKLTKIVECKTNSSYDAIRIYGDTKTILLKSKPYQFKDIIDYTLVDIRSTIGGESKAITKTSTSSVLGRSAVGALVAGPAGAIIGGGSASKETIITQSKTKTLHSYRINVTVNSIEEPLVSLFYGSNGEMANEVLALLAVVCRNK